MGTRYNTTTEESTILSFQFVKDGSIADAFSLYKVTIHPTIDDADADTSILQTITSTGITRTSTGTYVYSCDKLTTASTYYDKVFLIPVEGGDPITFVNSFVVSAPLYDRILPGEPGTCKITGTVVDHNGEPIFCARVHATLLEPPSGFRKGVYVFHSSTYVDVNGHFEIELIRGGKFIIIIREIGLMETILIPDQSSCDLWTLIASIGG